MARRSFLKMALVGFLIALGGGGCGSGNTAKEPPPAYFQLKAIGMAYARATHANDRPPTSKEELMEYLPETEKPADHFRSAGDGEEFVIHWGVDYRYVTGKPSTHPVLAYERHGQEGKRFVLQNYRFVSAVPLTQDEIANLPFPPGTKAP